MQSASSADNVQAFKRPSNQNHVHFSHRACRHNQLRVPCSSTFYSLRPASLLVRCFLLAEPREHKAHIMMLVLRAMDNPRSRQLFYRLRAAYNLTRPPAGLQVPPLEEWRGVSMFCHKSRCRCEVFFFFAGHVVAVDHCSANRLPSAPGGYLDGFRFSRHSRCSAPPALAMKCIIRSWG